MKPTLMCNTLASNVTSLLTSFANMNPFCSFPTPSLTFELTWFFILARYLLSFRLPLKCTCSCPLTSHKYVFYYQLALPPSSTLHNSVNRDVPDRDRKGQEAGRCISKLCSRVKYVPSLNHAMQSSLRSLLKGDVQVQGTVNYIAFVIRP